MRLRIPIYFTSDDGAPWFAWLTAVLTLAPFTGLLLPDSRVISSGEPNYGDYATYQLPIREFVREELLAGRFPLWIPYLSCGLPLLAGQQAAICYPFITPFVLALGGSYGSKVSIFFHFVLCFTGEYYLGRRLGLSRNGSSIAAAVATLCAFPIAHVMEGHLNLLFGYSLTPLFFAALLGLCSAPGVWSCLGLTTVAMCMVLTGHPQLPYYVFLFGLCAWTYSFCAGRARFRRLSCLAWTGTAAALVFLTASIQLLPTAELLSNQDKNEKRGSVDYADNISLEASDLLLFCSPHLKGNPRAGIPGFRHRNHLHERVGYFGLLPLLLAAFALSRRSQQWEIGMALGIIGCVTIALGKRTPIFAPLCSAVPGLSLFRCPGRLLSVASIFAALLAGRGVDTFLGGVPADRGVSSLGKLLTLLLLASGWIWVFLNESEIPSWSSYTNFVRSHLVDELIILCALVAFTLVSLVVCRKLRKGAPRECYLVLLTTIVGDLWLHNVLVFRLADNATQHTLPEIHRQDPPIRFVQGNGQLSVGESDLRYSRIIALALASHRGLIGTNEGGVLPPATETLYRAVVRNPEVALAVAGCGYQYDWRSRLWTRLPVPLPRIRFYTENDSGSVRLPISQIDSIKLEEMRKCVDRAKAQITLVEDTPQCVRIKIRLTTPGTLVLADTYYPGWKCLVDGEEREILPAHGTFRAVDLDKNAREVVFSYDPTTVRVGMMGSAVGVVLWFVLASAGLCRAYQSRESGVASSPANNI